MDPKFEDISRAFMFTFVTAEDLPTLDTLSRKVLGKTLDALVGNVGLEERINELLKAVAAQGSLDRLIKEAHALSGEEQIQTLHMKYFGARLGGTPFDVCWIPPAKAVFDRANIRKATRQLVQGEVRVLLINGPRKSGKSYCSTLMRHVSELSRTKPGPWSNDVKHALCEVDLRDHGGLLKPAEILQQIGHAIDLPLAAPSKQIAAAPRWYLSKITGLKPKLNKSRHVLWLVIDGLAGVPDGTDLLDFAGCYAAQAARSTELRAIFIDCPITKLPVELVDNGDMVEESVACVRIDDLHEFFDELAKKLEKPLKARDLAQEVWDEAAPQLGKEAFMATLAGAARKRVQAIG